MQQLTVVGQTLVFLLLWIEVRRSTPEDDKLGVFLLLIKDYLHLPAEIFLNA